MTHAPPLPRKSSRVTGILLIVLGAWGAIVPFIGPYFSYAYTPDTAWAYTPGRLLFSILPGIAVLAGGLIVLLGGGSPVAGAGALLAAGGGAWFVIGAPVVNLAVRSSAVTQGIPVAGPGSGVSPAVLRLLEGLGFFYGLGVVIVFLAALALGRLAASGLAAGYPAVSAEPEHVPPWRPYHAA